MKDDEKLFKILDLSQELRKYHHQALWEEEKHFTWWVSIIFPVLIFVYSSQLYVRQKGVVITIAGLLGTILSFLGLIVVRREGVYFKDAQEIFCRTCITLGLHKYKKYSTLDAKFALMPEYPIDANFDNAREKANKSIKNLLKCFFRPSNLGIRDCFQLIFIVSGLLFLGFIVFTWLSLYTF